MKLLILIFLLLLVTACQNLPKGDSEFYTWVDEAGNIRTLKKNSTLNNHDSKVKENGDFDVSNFTSSDQLEKKIAGERLYTWNENGHQVVVEAQKQHDDMKDSRRNYKSFPSSDMINYREGKQVLLSEINNTELKLKRYYQLNKSLDKDYMLIELDTPVIDLEVKSYIYNSTVSLPIIIPLKKDFTQAYQFEETFGYFQNETWYGYGYAYGVLRIPENTQYLLVIANPKVGMIETNNGLVAQSDLGVLSFKIIH